MTEILDGRPIAAEIEASLRRQVEMPGRSRQVDRPGQGRRVPGLAVVLFGDDSPSRVYGRMIGRGCERVGIDFRLVELDAATETGAAVEAIEGLNRDRAIDGILIKRPLPGALADEAVLQVTLPGKDVDGYHFENVGKLVVGARPSTPVPCTPAGVRELLIRSGHSPAGRHVVILGRSATVGKPLANLLCQKEEDGDATVTLCHQRTRDLPSHTLRADIVVTAVGSPGFLTREMVAPGSVVIDVGTNAIDDPGTSRGYRLVGDADFDGLLGHCAAITPVPGGVGPVTVAMLLRNVVEAASRREE